MSNRRSFIKKTLGLSAGLSLGLNPFQNNGINQRVIPRSGDTIPVIGLGTWQTFDTNDDQEKVRLSNVLRLLHQNGGTVVDSSPMYGRSESVVGNLTSDLGINEELFLATKVWTRGKRSGITQMENSLRRLGRKKLDLLQVHNLLDWQTHLQTLKDWKAEGSVKHIGITHYQSHAYNTMISIMKSQPIDFIQLNYSLAEREAEKKILPLAKDKGIAVIINRPYAGGALFRKTRDQALPAWVSDFGCTSWGQVFLKYILSNPAVTCAIPGTSKPKHLLDNLEAGRGRFPDPHEQQKILTLFKSL